MGNWLVRTVILRRGTGWMGVVELVGLKRDITARTAGGAACEMPSVALTGNAPLLGHTLRGLAMLGGYANLAAK